MPEYGNPLPGGVGFSWCFDLTQPIDGSFVYEAFIKSKYRCVCVDLAATQSRYPHALVVKWSDFQFADQIFADWIVLGFGERTFQALGADTEQSWKSSLINTRRAHSAFIWQTTEEKVSFQHSFTWNVNNRRLDSISCESNDHFGFMSDPFATTDPFCLCCCRSSGDFWPICCALIIRAGSNFCPKINLVEPKSTGRRRVLLVKLEQLGCSKIPQHNTRLGLNKQATRIFIL